MDRPKCLLPAVCGVDSSHDERRRAMGVYLWGALRIQLDGTALVTGANSGRGYEITLALARLGASVTMACRNEHKCREAAERIRQDEHYLSREEKVRGYLVTQKMDTSSLQSVQAFAQSYLSQHNNSSSDMICLNAGMAPGKGAASGNTLPLSQDGNELVFAPNHVNRPPLTLDS